MTAWLQPDAANGNLGPAPAAVYSLMAWNNGTAPLTVTVTLLLDGKPIGQSLDVGKDTATIAAGGQHEHWHLAVEQAAIDRSGPDALGAGIRFHWLRFPRTLTIGRGRRASF